MQAPRLRIAIQKKGRLNNDSTNLLNRCGLKFRISNNALLTRCEQLPIDILLVRDDDIPTLVMDGVCDLGIVGENVLFEKSFPTNCSYEIKIALGFGRCRLAIATPENFQFDDLQSLNGLKIATSYPNLLQKFINENNFKAEILPISGSVEIAPSLSMADAICDLVSTGRTLEENNLKEIITIIQSQAVLIKTMKTLSEDKQKMIDLLLPRISGVLKAEASKYILFHAPKSALDEIKRILPGFETPTIMPLAGFDDKVAVHLMSTEAIFWDTLEKLKQAGASSILVLPIEKMMS